MNRWTHECVDSQIGGWMHGRVIAYCHMCAATQPYLGNPDSRFSSDLP